MNVRKLVVFNTLTNQKEEFKPLVKNKVGMYVCGPTVYGEPHLGHARSAVTFDVVFRFLTHLGYKVRYLRNITDVGHLEDEQNESGEDKIAKKARLEQLEPMEVAQHYTNLYRECMSKLNVRPPSIEPLASGHIIEQQEIAQRIIDNGLAYVVNGSVYFDVREYAKRYHYGVLSGRVLEELLAGTRDLDGQNEKRFHADFALWKKADKGHIMQWSSPWGKGFPGWHIECTAMSSKYLGIPFDIHGGGMDLQFPHHEAEICQSLGAFDKSPVNYWLHNNMVTLNGQKMAKSKNNFITLNQIFESSHPLLERAYSPEVVRFYMLQAHYRSTIDFSNVSLQSAEKALKKLLSSLSVFESLDCNLEYQGNWDAKIDELIENCYSSMLDDFNTAELISYLFEINKLVYEIKSKSEIQSKFSIDAIQKLHKMYQIFLIDILGIQQIEESQNDYSQILIDKMLTVRKRAKEKRDFEMSDFIREQLGEAGIKIADNKDGSSSYSI